MGDKAKDFIRWFHVKMDGIFNSTIDADEEVAPYPTLLLGRVIKCDDIREIIMLEVLAVYLKKGIVSDKDNGNQTRFRCLERIRARSQRDARPFPLKVNSGCSE